MAGGYLVDGDSFSRISRMLLDFESGQLTNRNADNVNYETSTSPIIHPVLVTSAAKNGYGYYTGKLLKYDSKLNTYTEFSDILIRDVNNDDLTKKRYLGRLAGYSADSKIVYLVQLVAGVTSGDSGSGSGQSGSGSGVFSGSGSIASGSVISGSVISGSVVSGSGSGVSGSVTSSGSGACTGTCFYWWTGTQWALQTTTCTDACGPCTFPTTPGTVFGETLLVPCTAESGSAPDSGLIISGSESGSGSGVSGSAVSGSVLSGSVASGSVITSGSVVDSGSVASGSGVSGSVVSGSVLSGSGVSGSVASGSVVSGSGLSGSVAGSGSGSGGSAGSKGSGNTIEVVTDVQCIGGNIVVTKTTITIAG
jgi:hypothetical protein